MSVLMLSAQWLMAQQPITYDEAIIYGDQKFEASAFKDAKAYYQMALRFKPEDAYATEKVSLIIKKLQEKMAGEEAYYGLVDKADELYRAGKLNQAIIQYQNSLEVIPGDEYATGQIRKIVEFQAKEKEKLENYEQNMADAKILLATKKYDEAIAKFEQADLIFPENSEPGEQMTVAKTLKSDWLEKQGQCSTIMEEASRYILINDYEIALEKYQEALTFVPDNKEAMDIVREIRPLAEKQKKYNRQVEKADEYYINKDFIAARSEYEAALKLWPEKTYAGDMLLKIQTQLADQLKDLDKNYNLFIRRGDSLFDLAAYTEAKGEFNLALNLKPGEAYPKTRLADIDGYFASQRQAMEANYGEMIAAADSAYKVGTYHMAKEKYESALNVKPDDSYPQSQIDLINVKLDQLAEQERANQVYQALVAEADQLASAGQNDLAIAKYKEAQATNPMESYPGQRIEEITLLMADAEKQREVDEKYAEQVSLAGHLFNEDNLTESRTAWQNALAIKPYETMPKVKIVTIDSLVVERARQAAIDEQYQQLLSSGDSLQNLKFYPEAIVAFEQAALVKPADPVAVQKIQAVKTIQDNIEKEANRKRFYAESIAKADDFFEKENYELAKTEYEKALTFNGNEAYPKDRIVEIDQLLIKLAAEREQRFKDAVANGNLLFDQQQYQKALDEYQVAASIRPDDTFTQAKMSECNNLLAELMKQVMAEYNQAVAEADKLYEAKVYDKAIAGYQKAGALNPNETYPGEMIRTITKYIEDNAITDILNSTLTVSTKTTEKLAFDPVPVNVRKSNYIMVKARSISGTPVSVIFSYGSAGGKNGGFVVTIPGGDQSNEFIIRVGNQYKWFSEDNNWLEIYPENGDIELTLVRISTTN